MDNLLPTEFDIVIVGTGMVESIISAAASRIGKKVLHIDSNDYYGGQWASFNLDSIQKFGEPKPESTSKSSSKNEMEVDIGNDYFDLENFISRWHIPEKIETPTSPVREDPQSEVEVDKKDKQKEAAPIHEIFPEKPRWDQAALLKESRKFNIDLTPKLQFARGDLIELLISSNIARYSEYRSISRVLTFLNGRLEIVPCSRSDVFANSKVSVIEKRMLMKLLTSLEDNSANLEAYENKTFKTYLKDKKLTPNLIHYVLYAISMSTNETPCLEGVKNTKRFLKSLGRFGKTPFLFPIYGSGETPQSFCRLSAVFGGTYALNQPIIGFVTDEKHNFKALHCDKQNITADKFVIGLDKVPKIFFSVPVARKYISRAVFIIDKSIMPSDKEQVTLLLYPPEQEKSLCVIIELGLLTGTCPKDTYLVHMTTAQVTKPEEDLKHCAQNLLNFGTKVDEDCESKPNVLWSCYFSLPDCHGLDLKNIPENVFVCPGPDLDLDYDISINKAREIFSEICPDAEFLPRAPDPEEIIIEGDEEGTDENNEVCGDNQKETEPCESTEKELNRVQEIIEPQTQEE